MLGPSQPRPLSSALESGCGTIKGTRCLSAFQPRGDRREDQAHALRMMQSNSESGSTVSLVGSCIILRLLLGETNNPSLFKSGSSNKYWCILTGMLEYRDGLTGILENFLEYLDYLFACHVRAKNHSEVGQSRTPGRTERGQNGVCGGVVHSPAVGGCSGQSSSIAWIRDTDPP